jgi:hypothetical protein
LTESNGIEPEIDLPGIIGDEWADPEEFLNDFCSYNLETQIEARKHCPSQHGQERFCLIGLQSGAFLKGLCL